MANHRVRESADNEAPTAPKTSRTACFSQMHLLSYIDGGTGSMALQLILAGLLSGMYAVSTKWTALKKAIRERKNRA